MKKKFCIGLVSVLSLSMCGCSDNDMATINGVKISKEQYEKTQQIIYATAKYMDKSIMDEIEKSLNRKQKKEIENIAMSFIIDNELLYQQAKDKNFTPSEEEVKIKYDELEKVLNLNTNYKKELDKLGINREFLIEKIRKDMTVENYKKDFQSKISISEKEIKDYYEDNKSKFVVQEINASHILLSTIGSDKKEVSKEEKEKIKKNGEELLTKIKNGEKFEDIAEKYSDDKVTGHNGGNLGYFTKEDKNIEFTNEVFKLEKGQISHIIETNYGYHIVKINDKRDKLKSLVESENKIKENILNDKYKIHIESLNENANIKK